MQSKFGHTFMLLTKLAWASRTALPMLITAAFMAFNFRWEIEINIHTERIVFQDENEPSEDDAEWESMDEEDEDDGDMPVAYPIDYEYSV